MEVIGVIAQDNIWAGLLVLAVCIIGYLVFKLVDERFGSLSSRLTFVEAKITEIEHNTHKMRTETNNNLVSIREEVRETNENIKLITIKMGAEPMDFVKFKE